MSSPPWHPTPGIDPQDRQRGESAAAFEAYLLFRNMPPPARSTAQVAEHLGVKLTRAKGWRKTSGWTQRAAFWDAEVDKRARARTLEACVSEASKHLAVAQDMQLAALSEVRALLRRIQWHERDEARRLAADPNAQPRKSLLKPRDIARLAQIGVALERLHLALPTEITEHKFDLDKLSVEELRTLDNLVKRVDLSDGGNDAPVEH